jgi:beta-apo-4'-carotenal oxygenase
MILEIGAIPDKCKQVRTSFLSHKTRPIEFRLKQLRKLYWGYAVPVTMHPSRY